MGKRKMIYLATIGIGILSFICLLGLFTAFHDIFHDYVSSKVISNLGLTLSLPNSATCSLEWQIASISFWAIFLFNIVLFIISIWQNKIMKIKGIQ